MIILEALFFILPSYIANGCASLSRSIPVLKNFDTPIDFGKSWNGKRILGNGKTYRGLVFGTFCGVIAGIVQYFVLRKVNLSSLSQLSEKPLGFFVTLSFLLGLGALLGDALKSLVKRRIGITRGKPWPPFDQLDFLAGGLLLTFLYFFPGWDIVLVLLVVTPVSHLLSNITAYLLNLKDVWW